jgi:hypothetical protein
MTKKIDEALATLSRVVPTRFAGEVTVVKAEIERLREVFEWHRQTNRLAKEEIERLKSLAYEILEDYDDAKRRVIDEVVGSGRDFVISFHEFTVKTRKNEINGVDDDGADI